MKTTLDVLINNAEHQGFFYAGVLFGFAADVLSNDLEGHSRWVVQRACGLAEDRLRDAIDCGVNMNTVAIWMAAIRLRLGISSLRDILDAGDFADDVGTDGTALKLIEAASLTCIGWGTGLENEGEVLI